jgi:hypothetical protein
MNEITLTLGGMVRLQLEPAPLQGNCIITARFGGLFTATGKGFEMAYTLPSGMQVSVEVAYVDAQGHAATVDGEVTWASSADNIATVTVNPNNSMEASIAATSDLGTAQITATADADLGAGVRSLITTLDITVVAGEAVAGTISPTGEPVPIS